MIKFILQSLLIFSLFQFSFISTYAYELSDTDIIATERVGDRINNIIEDSSLTKTTVISLLEEYQKQKNLSERKLSIIDYLIEYITNSIEKNLIPWSIQEMKQKEFRGTDLVFEEVLDQNAVYTRFRISYKSDGLAISGIMNVPSGEGPYPLVILNHGYIDPAVYTVGRGLKREQDYLARAGYVVLHTDYRNHGLSDVSKDLDQNYYFRSYFYGTDSINAILAVKALWDPKIDTNKIAMMGHSMWWWVTMHSILAQPHLIDAAILYAPVHSRERENFERWRREDLSQDELDILSSKIWDITKDVSFAPYSPDTYLDEIQIPLQYYHGTSDKSVPYDRSVESVSKLQKTNLNVELLTFEGELHEFGFRWIDFMEWVVEFLDQELGSNQ